MVLKRLSGCASIAALVAACASGTHTGFGDGGIDAGDASDPDAAAPSDATTQRKGPIDSGVEPDSAPDDAAMTDAASDASADVRADGTRPADAGHHDAHSGSDAHDSAAPSDAPTDAMHDAAHDAGVDAKHDTGVDARADASDAADASACSLPAADAGAGEALAWAESFGSTGFTWATSVAIDPSSGDVVVAGFFDGTVNLGGGLLTSHGDAASGDDTFVAKFDTAGGLLWAKDFGNGLLTSANSVAVDGSGNIALGGGFEGTLGFGGAAPLTAVGDLDIFVVELDSGGNYLWGKSFGAAGQSEQLDTVAVDSSGSVIIGGTAVGGVDFGSGPATGYYIAKFTQAGAYSWSTAVPTSCAESNPTLAVDPSSNILLAGCFTGTVNFGGGAYTSEAGGDAFVAKYNPSGMYLWAFDYPADPGVATAASGSEVSSGGLAVDSCGDIFVQGSFGAATGTATIDFGAGALTSGADTIFLAKLDPSGNGVWSRAFTATTEEALYPSSLAVDGAGGVTLACGLAGSVNYGGGVLTGLDPGVSTASFASFDANGNYRWAYAAQSPSTATSSSTGSPQGLAAHGASLVVAGAFGGCVSSCNDGTSPPGTTLVLPGQTLTAVSAGDLFVASFAP